jgi:hypothetical protein
MRFYLRAYDPAQQIGPMSLSEAESVVRATGLAQRSRGSLVWGDGQGKLFIKEAGCELDALWVTDENDRLVNIGVVAEFATLRQQILWRVEETIETVVRRK